MTMYIWQQGRVPGNDSEILLWEGNVLFACMETNTWQHLWLKETWILGSRNAVFKILFSFYLKKYILITTVWLLLCPNPIGTSRLRLPSRDLRSVSKPHLKAICHNSLLIMQSADPDQALEEIMGGIETPYSNGLWTDSKSIWFTHISDFFSLFSYPEEVQGWSVTVLHLVFSSFWIVCPNWLKGT